MRMESQQFAGGTVGEGLEAKNGAAESSDFSMPAQPAKIENPAGTRLSAVLILGANGGIGRALAAEFASHQHDLILAGRDLEDLQGLAVDLNLRYSVRVVAAILDVLNFEGLEAALAECISLAGGSLEGVVLCIGHLGDPEAARTNLDEAGRILDTNFTGSVLALNITANHLEDQRRGFICALSSVAGDRGRQSNYLYGAAKSGLTTYLQGLRNRLYTSGVQVITVKPGYVDTRMVFGRTESRLVAQPDAVARRIYKAVKSRRNVVYIPWFWRFIMLIVRAVPEELFKRLHQ
jgi:decaprenylphospho-beta-D-erythro-pentofuranosid-2-ulose 2-reductase